MEIVKVTIVKPSTGTIGEEISFGIGLQETDYG
jgi:hypothetical protein